MIINIVYKVMSAMGEKMWKRVPRGGEMALLDREAGNRPHWKGEN